jgi:hypothetical protein
MHVCDGDNKMALMFLLVVGCWKDRIGSIFVMLLL